MLPPGRPVRSSLPDQADGQWHRVHLLTPAIKSWQMFVVILFVVAQEWGTATVGGSEGGSSQGGIHRLSGRLLAGGGLLLAALVLAALGMAFLSWRMTRFRVTEDALELQHGVLFRSQRRARLDRLQAVDVVQPLVARIVGLARLTVEVAGGPNSKIALSYLTDHQAQQLRNHLLAHAAGVRYDTPHAPEAPEHEVLELPLERLIGALVLSGPMGVFLTLVLGSAVGAVVTGSPAGLAAVLGLVIAAVSVLWNRFTGWFGFRVATSADGLRLRHGLLEHRTQTVPPGRVQAVRLSQPLLWRRADWWRVQVNVAGYGGLSSTSQEAETTLLPVGHRDEAMAVLAFVLPDFGVEAPEHPRDVVNAAMSGSGAAGGFVTGPRTAAWLDPLAWRRNGFRLTGQALVIRRGRLRRQVDVVPHARTQSCAVAQGPVQRRLGVASFHLHSTPGPIRPTVPHLAAADATRLLDEQTVRARAARAAAGPERWMESGAI